MKTRETIAKEFLKDFTSSRTSLLGEFRKVRRITEEICTPLRAEDHVIQSMPEVSPPKWHLAHTTWFFENFILIPFAKDYRPFHPQFGYLFNSYYETVGRHHPRAARGLLSRPSVEEILSYRSFVNESLGSLLEGCSEKIFKEAQPLVVLGLNHEQQHQELLLTDILHIFFCNPLRPVYQISSPISTTTRRDVACYVSTIMPMEWITYPGGIQEIGHAGDGFSFDNERPRHRVYQESFALGSRLITNGEFLEFIAAGGYSEPRLWLSDGWDFLRKEFWSAPLYWEQKDGEWWQMSLLGMRKVNPAEPICHVSYYEADAFARWKEKRLPTEAEWEIAAQRMRVEGNFYESKSLHPLPSSGKDALQQIYGDVWEWTQSAYSPYPGFKPEAGSIGEYNGKFMSNQMVLRGGSCATPGSHIRPTYRNFFPPHARWQFMGIRLAEDA